MVTLGSSYEKRYGFFSFLHLYRLLYFRVKFHVSGIIQADFKCRGGISFTP